MTRLRGFLIAAFVGLGVSLAAQQIVAPFPGAPVYVVPAGVAFSGTSAVGDLLCGNGANQFTRIAAVATGQVLAAAGAVTCPAYTATPSFTSWTTSAADTANLLALGTTSTDGTILQNTTAATGGVTVQISPRSKWCGTAWNSVGMASETDCFITEVLPATVAGTTTAAFNISGSIAGGAFSNLLQLTSAGTGTFAGSVVSGGSSFLRFNSRSIFSSPADAQVNLTNTGVTAGIGLDVSTDSTLKIRTRAQSGYGTLDALSYNASGTPITSGTTHLSAGSGMAVANVGANSCGTTAASIAGNNNAFVITVGATSGTQCRVAFTIAAGTEWDCAANDENTALAIKVAPVDTTHTDFLATTFTAGDKVIGTCFPR